MAIIKIKFTKMHGLGNDFVVIDGRNRDVSLLKKKGSLIASRRFGVGCDQILVLGKSRKADFRMQIFNADGSEVEMCGNGIRCLAKFLHDKKISLRKELRFETLGGIITTKLQGKDIEVNMGMPVFEGQKIPVKLQGLIRDYKLKACGREFNITCLSMGNPHCVIFLDNIDSFDLGKYGSAIEHHKLFPNRINVEFVKVVSKNRLKMRVWERGSGETMACGTGACASAVASRIMKGTGKSVVVELQGGNLKIEWGSEGDPVFMTGPAANVFDGVMEF